MRGISSAAIVIILIISISLVGSYFFSKVAKKPLGMKKLGIVELQAAGEAITGVACAGSGGTINCKRGGNVCDRDLDCTPVITGSCSGSSYCPDLNNTIVVSSSCDLTYNAQQCRLCVIPPEMTEGNCRPNIPCSVTGTCDYQCEQGWYDDDGVVDNGCENAPPRYFNPIGSSPINPVATQRVYHWINWTDLNGAGLSTAILEVNGSGINCDQTENVSFYTFSQDSEIANISWATNINCGGKVIAWKQYANDSANRWNVSETQTYYVKPADLSFNLTLPGENPVESSGSSPGTASIPINFSISKLPAYNVNACTLKNNCQDSATPIFIFKNVGNIPIQWNLSANQTLPSGIVLFGSKDNNPSNARVLVNSSGIYPWIVNSSIPVGAEERVWLWANFTQPSAGTFSIRILHHSLLS